MKIIFQFLQDEPKHVNEIIKETRPSASKVSSTLSMMKLSGLVKSLGAGVWKIVR